MTKRKTKKPKVEPKWRMVERVQLLIERMLDPSATVQHDVRLADLQTPDAEPRQCDIVVTTGPPFRRTRTIVEVQRRGRKVERAHFDAWVDKMYAVGAQHLVCVSAVGYSSSIIARAAQLGPTVRLATLSDLKGNHGLLHAAFGSATLRIVEVPEIDNLRILTAAARGTIAAPDGVELEQPTYRNSQGEVFSTIDLANRAASMIGDKLPLGVHRVELGTEDGLTLISAPLAGSFRLSFVLTVSVVSATFEFEAFEYRQLDEGKPWAWALVGMTARPDGKGVFTAKLTFRPQADGRITQHGALVEGVLPGETLRARFGDTEVGETMPPNKR